MATTSSSTSGSSISALGTGSGLELGTLLNNLISAEKAPQQKIITQKQTAVSTTVSALGTLKSSVSALQDAFDALKDIKSFNARTATSGNKDLFTATADNTADLGNYAITVKNLASANKLASGDFASPTTNVGTGKMTIAVGTTAFDLTIDSTNQTLTGVRDAINAAPGNNGQVKASIMTVSDGNGGTTNKLVLAAKDTGASSQISVTVTDSDGNNTDNTGLSQLYYSKADTTNSRFTEVSAAKDATITLDGFTMTSKSNVFTEAIPGVTITAVKPATDQTETTSLAIGFDKDTVKKTLDKFVSAYNAYAFSYGQLTSYNKDTDTAGPLLGNSSVGLLANKIRQGLTNPVPGAPADLNSLSALGITTNADGTLKVDTAKLDKVLSTRSEDVAKLFTGDDGIAGRMYKQLGDSLGAAGLFQNTENTLQKQLDGLKDQQTKLDARMVAREAYYRAQFTALDTIVAQLKQTGNFLTQQFAQKSDS